MKNAHYDFIESVIQKAFVFDRFLSRSLPPPAFSFLSVSAQLKLTWPPPPTLFQLNFLLCQYMTLPVSLLVYQPLITLICCTCALAFITSPSAPTPSPDSATLTEATLQQFVFCWLLKPDSDQTFDLVTLTICLPLNLLFGFSYIGLCWLLWFYRTSPDSDYWFCGLLSVTSLLTSPVFPTGFFSDSGFWTHLLLPCTWLLVTSPSVWYSKFKLQLPQCLPHPHSSSMSSFWL